MLSARPESMLQHRTQTLSVTYDVIVVLGAAVWPGGQPSPALQRRVMHAVDLMQRGYAAYLLVTGGMGQYPPTEASVKMLPLLHTHLGKSLLVGMHKYML